MALDEVVEVERRGGRRVRVTPTLHAALAPLREALVAAARQRRTVTWAEAAAATGAYPPIGVGVVVDVLDVDCRRRGEPPLGALLARRARRSRGDEEARAEAAREEAARAAAREACWEHWRTGER
ncbi:hypothetical protein SAMN05428996_1401 [Quadrisphaera sp. DSM 44207]|nr:hypothetical protein SAMN05428996_1401 [Quadrisphaera sp. DSM 44207]